MNTTLHRDLCSSLFGKTRRAILALTYGHPEESFYLRQIARAAGAGLGAAQRELSRLSAAGILVRRVSGRQVYFQADAACPIFDELRDMMLKTAALADVLREALTPVAGRIAAAFVHGELAGGQAGREAVVGLVVIGDVARGDVAMALAGVGSRLGREISLTIYSPAEFRRKAAAMDSVVRGILDAPKIHLIGG